MNIRAYLQRFGTAAMLGLAVGCAQQTTMTEAPDECQPSAAAQNAIDQAKAALEEAKQVAYAWRDTEALIQQAEDALKVECDNEKAIGYANEARRQAEAALAQYREQQQRFTSTAPEPAPPPATGDGMGRYEVERGDSLWAISARDFVYGDPYQWPLIYRSNSAIIEDADLIYPGQRLEYKQTPFSTDVQAAIRHAKTRGAWSLGVVEDSDRAYLSGN